MEDHKCSDVSLTGCDRVEACSNFFVPQNEDLIIEKVCSEEVLSMNSASCKELCDPYHCMSI
jgi:hypothetical protein